jgi:hypothetical protein
MAKEGKRPQNTNKVPNTLVKRRNDSSSMNQKMRRLYFALLVCL